MSIDSLRDGFVRLCFDPSLNVIQDGCRVLLEGQYYVPAVNPCIVVADVPVKITSQRDIDCQFGAGSPLAEGLKKAFSCCATGAIEFYALPRLDNEDGVKAAYTWTFTGPATTDGRIDIYMGEAGYNISVLITAGMTATQIAAAVLAAIPLNLPFHGVAAAGVLTFTARNAGTVGQAWIDKVIYNWHGRNKYAPAGVTFAVAQTVQGSVDPVPLDYGAVLGECCYCCIAMLYSDPTWQDGMIAYIQDSWACDKPQCFGHGYTYNQGSLGQILATDSDSPEVSRLAQCTEDPIFGYLKTVAYAVLSCCNTVNNPELSIQGPNFGVLSCLLAPESCTQCFTFDEQNELRDSGFVVTVPVTGGSGSLSSPMISNDITNNRFDAEGRYNTTFRDANSRRLATQVAIALAAQLQTYNGLGLFTRQTDIKAGVRGTNPRLILGGLRAWAKDNVGVLFSEFDNLDTDLTVQTDDQVAPKCQGDPKKLHVNMIYRPPVRVGEIAVNLRPRLTQLGCN